MLRGHCFCVCGVVCAMSDWEADIDLDYRTWLEERLREEWEQREAEFALEYRVFQGELCPYFGEESLEEELVVTAVTAGPSSSTPGSSVQASIAPLASCSPAESAPETPPRRTDCSASAQRSTPRKRKRKHSPVTGRAAEAVNTCVPVTIDFLNVTIISSPALTPSAVIST